MADFGLLILILCAIAIGWVLGRFFSRGSSVKGAQPFRQYYQGLNYLLSDQPDANLDAFVDKLEVNSDTLETHLTLGNLMRRKGEVERAIRIHQNLLSRPSLPRAHIHHAHLELARDFISAGLLDRAEKLLEDLLEEAPELSEIVLRHLLEIYQDEKEWQQAIDIAQQLLPKKSLLKSSSSVDASILELLAQYCCELAELSLIKNDYHSARAQLKKALSYNGACVRASLLAADIESRTAHYDRSIKILRRVREQDPVFVAETLGPLQNSFQHLNDHKGFYSFLKESLENHPSTSVLLYMTQYIKEQQSGLAAADFLAKQMAIRPTLRGLAKLIELHICTTSGRARTSLTGLQLLIDQLIKTKPQYQCLHCGFSGQRLHWLCPSCKQWGQMKIIRGVEGD